jgi:hypothetical protein
MKKFILAIALACITFVSTYGQGKIDFGITGGLLTSNTDIGIKAIGISLLDIDAINEVGFYVGILIDIEATEKFHVQPEVTYGSTNNLSFIYLPVMAKYYVAPKFNIMAGLQFTFSSNLNAIKQSIQDIEDVLGTNANIDDVLNTFGVDFSFGAGFDITNNFRVQAKYALPLTDIYKGPLGGALNIKNANLQVGVVYMFL